MLVTACGDNLTIEPAPVAACSDTSGNACTWAGKAGVFGFNGDNLHRLDTELYWTMDMKFASDGTVWFIDWNNHLVRKINPADDTVETVVGWTDPVFPGDGVSGNGERMPQGVPGLEVKLNHPTDLVETDDGKILVMAWHNHKVREIDPSTGNVRITVGAGAGFTGDGALASSALLRQPKGLERDEAGNLYILDQANLRIRKIDVTTGMMSTIAGNGMQASTGDGGPALSASLAFETGSNPEPSGGFALANGKMYIADTLAHRIRVLDLASGTIAAFAGTGDEGYGGDGGPAATAKFAGPRDLEIGPDGDLYIADTDNSRIRAIDLETGNVRTVAGTGVLGLDDLNDVPATKMRLARPFGIEFDPDGNLYISDTINSRIVKVNK